MIREFRLSAPGGGIGISCDANGASIGSVALLRRSNSGGIDRWEPGDRIQLAKQLGSQFGLPIDFSSKMAGLRAIANALNDGDIARAQIAAVLLGIPDPPPLVKGVHSDARMIQFIRELHWSGMIDWNDDAELRLHHPANILNTATHDEVKKIIAKAGFNPDEPRDERGRWTTGGSGGADLDTDDRSARIQLADAGMSDAWNDPVAEAARAAARRNSAASHAQANGSGNKDFWQTVRTRFSDGVEAIVSDIGQEEVRESYNNLTQQNAVADALRSYAEYRAQPWIDSDGHSVRVSVIDEVDPLSHRAALWGHLIFQPNAPLTRPGTNADWIDPLAGVASTASLFADPPLAIEEAGAVVTVDSTELAADSSFIILPRQLPKNFNITWPIGKFAPKSGLTDVQFGLDAHQQIGRLLQDAAGQDVNLILRTGPGEQGVDVEARFEDVGKVGLQFGEIKPMSAGGISRFNSQTVRWKLSAPVQAIVYDKQGNIYYGFVGPW